MSPKRPARPDFINHCKQLTASGLAAHCLVREDAACPRGPCEVGVYLPVCGHPGFMAVIQ